MKKYYLLLLSILFSACVDTPEPVSPVKEFEPYNAIQNSCIELSKDRSLNKDESLVFENINLECRNFIEVLEGANLALKMMKLNKNNATYYSAKEKYKKENSRLKKQHRYLNLILKKKGLDAIDENNLAVFKKVVDFSEHPLNISYYAYMQRYIDIFKNNTKLLKFEKGYSAKKYASGYALVNRGKYTQGLSDLVVAANMKNVRAARLCGDVFTELYPSRAGSCYSLAVESGDTGSMYPLARFYEEEENKDEAYNWYLKSANVGNFISQYKLYKFEKDKGLRTKWLKKSADRGYDKAQYEYGQLLAKNNKYDEAEKYLKKAVNQNYMAANYPLGKLYFQDKKYKDAYKLLSDGNENADSMYMLAYLNEHGKGVSRNYYSAINYYKKAEKFGKSGVEKDIKRVKKTKNKLKARQVKRQQVQAKLDVKQMNANYKRQREVEQEDKRIKGEWNAKKSEAIRLKVQTCGQEPNKKNLSNAGERIHLEGTFSHWLGKNAFIVNVCGNEYYVKDENDEARANKGDSVNFVAVSTGRREITQGLRRSIFEEADETAIQKAYALDFEGVCPY